MRQCDTKLSPTLMRIFEEIEKEPTLDCSHVDIINYLNHEREILQRNFITQNNQIITNPMYMNKSYGSKCKMTAGVKTPNASGTREKYKVKIKSRGDQVVTLQAYFKMLLNYFGNKKGYANLDEIEAKI